MISFINYKTTGAISQGTPPEGLNRLLLTGTAKGTIVKSLEIMTGNESCYVKIIRTHPIASQNPTDSEIEDATYATVRIDMKANDYLVLWEGFFVIPNGDRIYVNADSTKCTFVANAVEMS